MTEKETKIPSLKKRSHIKIDSDPCFYEKCNFDHTIRSPPPRWTEIYNRILEYRRSHSAPVDSMGCSSFGDWGKIPESESRYRILVSLLLSSRTKDEKTHEAMRKLIAHGLTISKILKTDVNTLTELINSVGFKNKKSKYLLETTKILHEKYNNDIPKTVEEMIALPGFGPKMAYLLSQEAWKNTVGIGIDTHMHRICNRLHWVNSQNPEETRIQLQSWLPPQHWDSINEIFVGFGQTLCSATNPKCSICPANDLCPSSESKPKSKKIKKNNQSND